MNYNIENTTHMSYNVLEKNFLYGGELSMEKRIKRYLLLIVAGVFMLCFAACGGASKNPASQLAGKWTYESTKDSDRKSQSAPDGFPDEIEFFSDGTGSSEGYDVAWVAENGRIKIVLDNYYVHTFSYKCSNKSLSLTDDEGVTVNYKK